MLNIDIHNSWSGLITPEFINKVKDVENKVGNEIVDYYPEKKNVFRFLTTDLNNIKCIILGMEPYPSHYYDENGNLHPVATGRSFEIDNINSWQESFKQSSLRNMLKTIYYNDTGKDIELSKLRELLSTRKYSILEPKELFKDLESQGVLFLNATLTVQPNHPDTHTVYWEDIMNDVLSYINSHHSVKWLLFGNKAKDRIENSIGLNDNVYTFTHPRLVKFIHENPFALVPEINWKGKKIIKRS